MIQSEILKEKDRIQTKLSEESVSIHEYLVRSHLAAEKIAESYGFRLQYAEVPNKALQPTVLPALRYGKTAAELDRYRAEISLALLAGWKSPSGKG